MLKLLPPDLGLAVLGILSAAAEAAEELQIQRLTLALAADGAVPAAAQPGGTQNNPGSAKPSATTSTAAQQSLQLQGIAGNDQTVMKYIAELERVGVFGSVELKSTSEFQLPQRIGRQFQIECRLGE